jgi:hypothetical protein
VGDISTRVDKKLAGSSVVWLTRQCVSEKILFMAPSIFQISVAIGPL